LTRLSQKQGCYLNLLFQALSDKVNICKLYDYQYFIRKALNKKQILNFQNFKKKSELFI